MESYSITEAYSYPVTPDSPEWATMTTEEKIAACQVPEDILKNLSPNALAVTMANYPVFSDPDARTDIAATLNTSNVLAEALARCEVSVYGAHSYGYEFDRVTDYAKEYYSDVLWEYVYAMIQKLGIYLSPLV